jgi:lipoprotein-anchoring transpeptidase ErfK/SrfK
VRQSGELNIMRLGAVLAVAGLIATLSPAFAGKIMFDPETKEIINPLPGRGGMAVSPIKRVTVPAPTGYKSGTIIVNTIERRLYLIQPDGTALKYGIGVGRDGFQWGGTHSITMKKEWPDWRPPAAMLKRRPDLPRFMPGGPNNPLGARAMYLGSTIYRIHGSNEPQTIGQAVSSGCFRMANEDVMDLYERVNVGTRVVILR